MELSPYFLPGPEFNPDRERIEDFERVYARMLESGPDQAVEYDLDTPVWQFLTYIAENKNIVLHGSGNANIAEFETRKSNDNTEFGNRNAIYASSDAIWAMFFAVVDRTTQVRATMNTAFRILEADGSKGGSYYFFSVNKEAFVNKPWRQGTIYVLPRETFEQEAPEHYQGAMLESPQWAAFSPVKPLGKLTLQPEDFPFLDRILPHDQELTNERARRNPEGFPWMED